MGKARDKPRAWVDCSVKELPAELHARAFQVACEANPLNRPRTWNLPSFLVAMVGEPDFLAYLPTKYWGPAGADLSVSFLDSPSAAVRNKVLDCANDWGRHGNVRFRWTQGQGDLRVHRGPGGYYSYLGTDNRLVPAGEHTMNLQGFSERTPDSEYLRVVKHEFGHALGFPHEHTRPDIVELLDERACVDYFGRTQGWSERDVRSQVLNPMRQGSFKGTPQADPTSIMCYGFPAAVTKSRKPIPGGADINASDAAFIATVYPKAADPVSPPPAGGMRYLVALDEAGVELSRWDCKRVPKP